MSFKSDITLYALATSIVTMGGDEKIWTGVRSTDIRGAFVHKGWRLYENVIQIQIQVIPSIGKAAGRARVETSDSYITQLQLVQHGLLS